MASKSNFPTLLYIQKENAVTWMQHMFHFFLLREKILKAIEISGFFSTQNKYHLYIYEEGRGQMEH